MAKGGRRHAAARRCVQAAHVAVRLPGPRRRRRSRSSPTSARPPGCRSSPRSSTPATCAVVAEHADMLQIGTRNMANVGLLQAVGTCRQAGAPQARHDRDHRGVADGRGVRRPARQPRHRPVRARHPDLRDGLPQHPRHLRGPGRPGDQPPAGRRRPEPRRRPQGPRRAAGPRRDRGRRGRRARRRAPAPRGRALRRARRRSTAASCASSRPPYAGCRRRSAGSTRRRSCGPADLRRLPSVDTIRSRGGGDP